MLSLFGILDFSPVERLSIRTIVTSSFNANLEAIELPN